MAGISREAYWAGGWEKDAYGERGKVGKIKEI